MTSTGSGDVATLGARLSRRRFLGLAGATAASTFLAPRAGAQPRATTGAIDMHAHYFPHAYLESIARDGGLPGFSVDMSAADGPTLRGGGAVTVVDDRYWNLEKRLDAMQKAGVQMQALSLTMPMPHLAAGERAAALATVFNDSVIDACRAYPERFVGCIALPLRNVAAALAELRRASRAPAMRAVYLPTNINGVELSDSTLDPLYEAVQTLGLPIILHPHPPVVGLDRMQRFYLPNLLGNPFDTTLAAVQLIAGGVLDRFPRLTVVLPHAGGAFPFLYGRVQKGQQVIPDLATVAERPVAEYVRRFYYDTITHSADALAYVVQVAGADRVLLGSDYRFNMGDDEPRAVVDRLPITAADRERILFANARTLLRMP